MKNKPLRHKERNTFKFVPFSERISNTKIDVVHQVKHKYELQSDETTYFYQAYEKWILLNKSRSFDDLKTDITPDILTLPQLLARKDELVEILQRHLALKDPLTLQALLEFIVALAQDIQQEFYPHFFSFFNLLISFLKVKNVEHLEWVFECLAYLFKLQWRYLLNNITELFDALLPLLDSSCPYYINNFAAQSFSFVARKIKDETKLIKLITRPLKEKPQAIEGCGRLLFEIIRGIPGQLHGCGEKIITSFIAALGNPVFPRSIICELLSNALTHLILFISKEHCGVLWRILQDFLKNFHTDAKINKSERAFKNSGQILIMIQKILEFKSCHLLSDPNSLITLLLKLIEPGNQIQQQITDQISSMLAHILLSSKSLPQELSSRIVLGAMSYLPEKDLLAFSLKIIEFSGFNGLVLPKFLNFCLEKSTPELTLPYLAKLVLHKAPPASDTRQLLLWTPYSLNFNSKNIQPSVYGTSYIENLSKSTLCEFLEDYEKVLQILYVLPHILPLPKQEAVSAVKNLIELICESEIKQNDQDQNSKRVLFLLSIALEALIYLKPNTSITKLIAPDTILPILLKYSGPEYLFLLRSLDFYISSDELNEVVRYENEVRNHLTPLLLSPNEKVRLHVTHTLYEVEKATGNNDMLSTILETCWNAECVPVSISEYREKLKIIQKLECTNESLGSAVAKKVVDGKLPLRYLFGVLFVNFKLLWDPISKIISSYGSALTPAEFWEVFEKHLDEVESNIRGLKEPSVIEVSFTNSFLRSEFERLNYFNEKPDYVNYRILMLKILGDIPDVYEFKSKSIVIHFLSFLEEEYNKKFSEVAKTWNIKLPSEINETLDETNVENSQITEEMEVDINEEDEGSFSTKQCTDSSEPMEICDNNITGVSDKKEIQNNIKKLSPDEEEEVKTTEDIKKQLAEDTLPESEWKSKWITKSLLAYMRLFGKFRSPKSLYKEPELYQTFLNFLSSKNPEVQKCVLDFILSYKLKHFTLYKEHLYGLIDEKNFKNELSIFRIDKQSDGVRPEHRTHLIPIVLRIVLSKMYIKGNTSVRQIRKAAILRFLSGCSSEELSSFFNMAFCHLMDFIQGNCEEIVDKTMNNIDLEQCFPPRRLLSAAGLLSTIITHCGGLIKDVQLTSFVKLILFISSYPPVMFTKRDEVHPGYLKIMKTVKTKCFDFMSQFFVTYEKYDWSEDEIKALFKVMVWPYLKQLPSEGVNSPNALMKIFHEWSKNPRFFNLLNRKNESEESPLSAMMTLWTAPKLHASVHNFLVEIVFNMLSIEVDEDDAEEKGSDVLSTYLPSILEIFQSRLTLNKSLSKKELSILSYVTTSAKEHISSESLLSLVLPSLLKPNKKGDEEITDLLNTVGNLIIKSNEPYKYLKQIVSLFSFLKTPGHRKLLLTSVFQITNSIMISLNEKVLDDLNAWDHKWVEQPDFNRRLQAFSEIEKINERHDPLEAAIIIRTSFYYLKEEKDLSIKDGSRYCLRGFCPKVVEAYKETEKDFNFLLEETILPLIKKGLNDEDESFRQETISFLGFMVRSCGEIHRVFRDLKPLSSSADIEVDFFENLVHLQLHRRVRAMLRFADVLENSEVQMHPKTLILYAKPMISQFLLTKKYADKNTIVDSAIKAIGAIFLNLSWRYYCPVFKWYLGRLQSGTEYQKQLIRVVSEIINAFHFDLTCAEEIKENVPNIAKDKESLDDSNVISEEKTDGLIPEEETIDEIDKDNENDVAELPLSKSKSLSKEAANKIIQELSKVIVPNLQKLLAEKLSSESYHKVNKKFVLGEKEEDEILRIPLAIAIIKLLQKLPSPWLLERNLPGIFLKLANFLKSRSEAVRRCARTTLEAIMYSLGPKYLPKLISEFNTILTKGFQIHVLAYTVHAVMAKLKPLYSKGDLDPCVNLTLSICMKDLFGDISEEKEVTQIVAKTIEAKAKRSYDIFHILSAYVSETFLLDLVVPLKDELNNTVSHKTITKASDCLQQIVLGLTENVNLPPESLLEFSYGLVTESIPILMSKENNKRDVKDIEYQSRKDPDIFLIPDEPKQKKALMRIECAKMNAHILIEFGLKLIYFLLKREKINKPQFKPMLEPLVKLFLDCLNSQHVKVGTLALKCFAWILPMDLANVKDNIKEISKHFLEILHKYAVAGLSKGDNFDLVMAAFKAVSVLVRSVKIWQPDTDERRVLLLYCEQDIEDRERQATAFSLLKALIQKGISSDELNSVMKKVATVSIISPIDSVRTQARQVMLMYLMEYSLGKGVLTFVSFYLSQLSYETKVGRESAMTMVRMIISSFPEKNLNEECGLIFVNVATRLINEDDADCKKEAASLIVLLIQKLDQNSRDKLFDVNTTWVKGKKILHRQLGMQLLGLFATAEKENFSRRLKPYLEMVVNELKSGFLENKSGRFVLLKHIEEERQKQTSGENPGDHMAFHTLQSIIKVFTLFPNVLTDNEFAEFIEVIHDECQTLLAHEHEWVRTLAVQVLGMILTTKKTPGSKSLALDLVSQLIPSVGDALLMQTMKLLVHIAATVSNENSDTNEVSLPWLIRKVRLAVNKEIVHSPTSHQIRMMACRWGAALSLKLNRTELGKVAFDLLSPIVRELSSEDPELLKAAKEASGYIKGKLGQMEYNTYVSRISQNIEMKKAARRKQRSQLAVTDPETAAKRKINRQLKKKENKKRKIELMKTHKFKRKPKKKDIDLEDM